MMYPESKRLYLLGLAPILHDTIDGCFENFNDENKKTTYRSHRRDIVLFACLLAPLIWIGFGRASSGEIQLLADIGKYNKGEPTPFQPFHFTATPTSDVQPITGALVPSDGFKPPDDQVNLLLLGSDWRPNSGYRTDVVLLVSINTTRSDC